MSIKQKGVSSTLVVVLITTFLAGFLVYQKQTKLVPSSTVQPTAASIPTSQPSASAKTTDWKTYDGDNFTFQYPANWEVTTRDTGVSGIAYGIRYPVLVYDPTNFTLGGTHQPGNTKNYRHSIEIISFKLTSESNQGYAEKSIQEIKDSPYSNKNPIRIIKGTFDNQGQHYEFWGRVVDKAGFVDPTMTGFYVSFQISNGKALLGGLATIHDSSNHSIEYKILSSIKLK